MTDLEFPDDSGNANVQLTGSTPGLRLVGTETSGGDLGFQEDAGTLKAWDFAGAAQAGLAVSSLTDGAGVTHAGELADVADLLDVENTDGTAVVSDTTAMQAGADLTFSSDGDGTATLDFDGDHGSDTQSGDGTTTTFTVSHGLGAAPSQVVVTPTSGAADGDHHVANKTTTSFDIVYASAPAAGTSNLSWDYMAF